MKNTSKLTHPQASYNNRFNRYRLLYIKIVNQTELCLITNLEPPSSLLTKDMQRSVLTQIYE